MQTIAQRGPVAVSSTKGSSKPSTRLRMRNDGYASEKTNGGGSVSNSDTTRNGSASEYP